VTSGNHLFDVVHDDHFAAHLTSVLTCPPLNWETLQQNDLPRFEEWVGSSQTAYEKRGFVFSRLRERSVKSYAKFYLLISVLQLTAIMNNIAQYCMDNFQLELIQSISVQSYSFNVAMSMSREPYEFIQSESILKFILSAVRGPIETSVTKIATSNTDRFGDFDGIPRNKSEILYADVVGLCAACMKSPLGVSGYRWLTKREISKIDFSKISKPPETNMLLEVDLKLNPL
jgi:hypothetical protein